jgi:hypothetical protein
MGREAARVPMESSQLMRKNECEEMQIATPRNRPSNESNHHLPGLRVKKDVEA